MQVLLPDVHRAAHDQERVVALEVRDRLARVQRHRIPGDPVGAQQVAEDPGMADVHVLEHEQARAASGHQIDRP